MKTIINNTDHVITVSNSYFSKDIAINESLNISDEEINNDDMLNFKFFSLKEKNKTQIEEVRTFGNRFGLWISSVSYIPIKTKFCVEKYNEFKIEFKSIEFIFITKFFKKICLQKPVVTNCKIKQFDSFVNPQSRRKFKNSILTELFITLPISVILLYATLASLFQHWGCFETITLSLFTIFSIYSNIRKLNFLVSKFKK